MVGLSHVNSPSLRGLRSRGQPLVHQIIMDYSTAAILFVFICETLKFRAMNYLLVEVTRRAEESFI